MDQSEIAALDRAQLGAIDTEVLEAVDETTRETIEAEMQSREALFIGLGDAVIPTVLVASAAFFIETGPVVSLASIEVTVPALTAMIGTVVGLVVLLSMVLKGKAHAGLPLLNGGTILGYLFGALLVGMSLVEAVGLDTLA
jgi:presenilin-like A22 family membrane protease